MGAMSDLHLLSGRVLDGETVQSVARGNTYDKEEIAWATAERLMIDREFSDQLKKDIRQRWR